MRVWPLIYCPLKLKLAFSSPGRFLLRKASAFATKSFGLLLFPQLVMLWGFWKMTLRLRAISEI